MLLQSLMPDGAASAAPSSPEEFAAWLQTLAPDAKGDAARALAARLRTELAVGNLRSRLKLLELALAAADRLLVPIETELNHAVLPLQSQEQQRMVAANGLLKILAAGYGDVIAGISDKWLGLAFQKPLRLAVLRAMQVQSRRLVLSYRIYARGSRSAWIDLHRLYRTARQGGYARQAPPEAAEAPEQVYLKALLLAFAEPTTFAPGELERVRFYVERHAALARLVDAAKAQAVPGEGCFLIRLKDEQAGRSLRKWSRAAAESGDLILQCDELLARLRAQLDGLARGIAPLKLGLPLAARRPDYQAMLHTLARLWSAPPTRRFSRQRFKPRVDIVVGFDELWSFLAGPAFRRRFDDGRRARQAAALNITEWCIANESPGGFALQYMHGNPSAVRVGEIVGVRPREHAAVHVCITRRVVSNNLSNLELGLQKLAPQAAPAVITVPMKGGAGRRATRPLRLIVLTRLPAVRNVPALVAPPGEVQPGMKVRLPYRGRRITLRVGELLETSPSCEIFALVPDVPAAPG